jgi:hypothetical protein
MYDLKFRQEMNYYILRGGPNTKQKHEAELALKA